MEIYPEYENLELDQAVELFDQLNKEIEELSEKKTDKQNRYDFLRRTIIPKLMEDKDITSARFSSIGRGIRIQDEFFVSSREEQREQLYQWLVDHGEADLIKPTVAPSTLKAFVSRAMKEGKEYPSDHVNVTITPTARFY
jgi:hypothetical protein